MPTVEQVNAFVGLPYEEGKFDCADLVALVQKRLYGRDVVLPGHRPQGAKTQAAAIRRNADELAVRIPREEATDGDVVLLTGGGHMHVGTLFYLSGMAYVLHNSFTAGQSLLQRLSAIPMNVEGFYRWK
jgi:hypothetical protein